MMDIAFADDDEFSPITDAELEAKGQSGNMGLPSFEHLMTITFDPMDCDANNVDDDDDDNDSPFGEHAFQRTPGYSDEYIFAYYPDQQLDAQERSKMEFWIAIGIIGELMQPSSEAGGGGYESRSAIASRVSHAISKYRVVDKPLEGICLALDNVDNLQTSLLVKRYGGMPLTSTMVMSSSKGESIAQVISAFSMAAWGGPVSVAVLFLNAALGNCALSLVANDKRLYLVDPHPSNETDPVSASFGIPRLGGNSATLIVAHDFVPIQEYISKTFGSAPTFIAEFFTPGDGTRSASPRHVDGPPLGVDEDQNTASAMQIDDDDNDDGEEDASVQKTKVAIAKKLEKPLKESSPGIDLASLVIEDEFSSEGKRLRSNAAAVGKGSPRMRMESEESEEKRAKTPPPPQSVDASIPSASGKKKATKLKRVSSTRKSTAAGKKKSIGKKAGTKATLEVSAPILKMKEEEDGEDERVATEKGDDE